MNNETKITQIYHKICGNRLTGRCMDDGCTDGYEVSLVLLAQEILEICKDIEEK